MFVDEAKVTLSAGNGGDGCLSFRREKYLPKGGPNGGDGGRGGSVILHCDRNVSDLTDYRFKHEWKARHGEPGRGRQQHGANGADCVLKVPPGTVVYDVETGDKTTELLHHEQCIVLLEGGSGGLGNIHFKSSTNQAPRKTTPGKPGQQGAYRLVLKTIADVGLVGYPNAGKSSLLTLLTNAHPKTAAYPFTTLHPHVGVIDYDESYDKLIMADIPGLIEGASENRGLGHRFLRHIERCRVLLFILDMAGTDDRDPLEDLATLRHELEAYSPALMRKPRLVVGNKMDEPGAPENLTRFRQRYGEPILPISILSEEGIPKLTDAILKAVRSAVANGHVEPGQGLQAGSVSEAATIAENNPLPDPEPDEDDGDEPA